MSEGPRMPRAALGVVAAALPVLFVACVFNRGGLPLTPKEYCESFTAASLVPTTSASERMVYEDDFLAVYHGSACVEPAPKSGVPVTVQGTRLLPRMTDATVFLNGWSVKYEGENHHVRAFGTALTNIVFRAGALSWHASGALTDDDGNQFAWCYRYTVVGWNRNKVHLDVRHDDGSCDPKNLGPANWYVAEHKGEGTALTAHRSYLESPTFTPDRAIAILPRGFGMGWTGSSDHHVLQVAYHLDHPDVFVEGTTANSTSQYGYCKKYDLKALLPAGERRVGTGIVTWETYGIVKDNDDRRDTIFGEFVSGLSGEDLRVVQPPFAVLPVAPVSSSTACLVDQLPAVAVDRYVVEDIPFDYAFPLLTGWDLRSTCRDYQVRSMGVWIDDFSWEQQSGKPGRLRYALAHDLSHSQKPDVHSEAHRVTIVGVKLVPHAADLVPVPDPKLGYCRKEGSKLRVTVKNQGDATAPPSTTRVAFGATSSTLPTRQLASGDSTDLLFDIPLGCFHPNCEFQITVNAGNEVAEDGGERNDVADGICKG